MRVRVRHVRLWNGCPGVCDSRCTIKHRRTIGGVAQDPAHFAHIPLNKEVQRRRRSIENKDITPPLEDRSIKSSLQTTHTRVDREGLSIIRERHPVRVNDFPLIAPSFDVETVVVD